MMESAKWLLLMVCALQQVLATQVRVANHNVTFTLVTDVSNAADCHQYPATPINAMLRCSNYRTCVATCRSQYEFPSGETRVHLACEHNRWRLASGAEVPDCQAICWPPCENGGMCVAPNQCVCKQNYGGARCEQRQYQCQGWPPVPLNSRRSCLGRNCTVQCFANHQLPNGQTRTTITCRERGWVPDYHGWSTVPDCEPVCDPPCRNGGRCIAPNLCVCDGDYKGPQCQYECRGMPTIPNNSMVRCNGSGSCIATCRPLYRFSIGRTELSISCKPGGWLNDDTGRPELPDCEPECSPMCRNGGTCVAPNTCVCADTYSGPVCELEDRYCTAFPRTPLNSFKTCNARRCVMECAPDYHFMDSLSKITLTCRNGFWIATNAAWNPIPDCVLRPTNTTTENLIN